MHARFILEVRYGESPLSEDDFLIAARVALVLRDELHAHPLVFGVAHVHRARSPAKIAASRRPRPRESRQKRPVRIVGIARRHGAGPARASSCGARSLRRRSLLRQARVVRRRLVARAFRSPRSRPNRAGRRYVSTGPSSRRAPSPTRYTGPDRRPRGFASARRSRRSAAPSSGAGRSEGGCPPSSSRVRPCGPRPPLASGAPPRSAG